MSIPVLILGSDGDSTRIVYNRLAERFTSLPAIIEEPMSRKTLLRNRIRKLGFFRVASQVAFMVGVRPILSRMARQRIEQIKHDHELDISPIPKQAVSNVPSVNAPQTLDLIAKLNPKIIVVNGTRILSRRILEGTGAVFINTHTGITPAYRGVHGGYWALYNRDPGRCGVTVHLVDAGIDTGEIIAQNRIVPAKGDSFITYPYLQIAAALPLLLEAIERALSGTLIARKTDGDSAVWYHPGIFQYLGARVWGIR